MKLLIIESPGKQQTIQKYLGEDWKVIASFGHIRGLTPSIDFLQNDFETSYDYIKEKADKIKAIKEAAKGASAVYLGADKDLEGEQIAYSLCMLLRLNPATAHRIIFTEITEKAIKAAIESPGRIDMARVHAQQARAMLDMMIGFTVSPLLWKRVAEKLSAGRCQTPALRLVVEREDMIAAFQSSSSWQLTAIMNHNGFSFPATMTDHLEDEESAQNQLENLHQATGHVVKTNLRGWTESAPLPLITSTLQQQASAKFGLCPKDTMKIAQRLYEAGHITYMRTDQAVLSEDAQTAARDWVREHYGNAYVHEDITQRKGNGGSAQEAHEAIRPTHMEITEIEDPLMDKVYRLIWQHAVQSIMSSAKGEYYRIVICMQDDTWDASWKRTTFEGWRRAGHVADLDEEEPVLEDGNWERAIQIKEGTELSWETMKASPKETKATARYTEATLVRELESYGIGRPSTFASLLSAIQDRAYVEIRDVPPQPVTLKEYHVKYKQWPFTVTTTKKKIGGEKKKLMPTELGRSVWRVLQTEYADLFDYGFTAIMEQRLDRIAKGEEWKAVLRDTWASYKARYEALSKERGTQGGKVREFNGVKAVMSKKGPLLLIEGKGETQFLGWPAGIAFDQLTEADIDAFRKQAPVSHEIMGEWKGQAITKHAGKFGPYLRCGDTNLTFQEDESVEAIGARIEAKRGAIVLKEYTMRNGPHGWYIYKQGLKKPQFVSVPQGIDPATLGEKEAAAIYRLGLEAKRKK